MQAFSASLEGTAQTEQSQQDGPGGSSRQIISATTNRLSNPDLVSDLGLNSGQKLVPHFTDMNPETFEYRSVDTILSITPNTQGKGISLSNQHTTTLQTIGNTFNGCNVSIENALDTSDGNSKMQALLRAASARHLEDFSNATTDNPELAGVNWDALEQVLPELPELAGMNWDPLEPEPAGMNWDPLDPRLPEVPELVGVDWDPLEPDRPELAGMNRDPLDPGRPEVPELVGLDWDPLEADQPELAGMNWGQVNH